MSRDDTASRDQSEEYSPTVAFSTVLSYSCGDSEARVLIRLQRHARKNTPAGYTIQAGSITGMSNQTES